jgi:hypothetical protein
MCMLGLIFFNYKVATSANIFDKNQRTIYSYKVCEKCNSDNIAITTKTKTALCLDCHFKKYIGIENGLKRLVEKTIEALPTISRKLFISEQHVKYC